jgi:sugar lactone lactonase YvrE
MPDAPYPLGRRTLLRGGTAAAALAPLGCAQQGAGARGLELVASFSDPHQVTGVAVTPSGRIFVNFPRWEEDVAISVAEVGPDGVLTPYPDAAWNGFRAAAPAAPGQRFVSVQSVATDPLGNLWIVDAAAPNLGFEVPGGPKLVRIDLGSNQVSRIYRLDERVAPQGTYLNDIRFTPDGQRAVLTNSGQPGSLITLDVGSGQARRVLDGHPSTQFEQDVAVVVGGRQLKRPDGQPPQFSADGIAIDGQGEHVYWQATTGRTMYRAPVAALFDARMDSSRLGSMVELFAQTFVADGYWMGRNGTLYLTSCGDNAVKRMLPDRQFAVEVQDSRLLWPDSMAEGPDGSIYVTASHIPQMMAWQGPGVTRTQLFRFRPT